MRIEEVLSEKLIISEELVDLLREEDEVEVTGKELKEFCKANKIRTILKKRVRALEDDEVYSIRSPSIVAGVRG